MPRAEDYEHLPIEHVHLEWKAPVNKPRLEANSQEIHSLSLDLAVHPNNSGRIIVNYPGIRGDIDGFNGKHRKLAQYIQGEGLAAVVRGKGPGFPDFNGFTDDTQLRKMISFALADAEAISASRTPELLLIGTSAGGGAVAAIAHEYRAVSRILLMAPGSNIGMRRVREGLSRFLGEVYIVIGDNDTNVGTDSGETFYKLATGASHRELFTIPDCDHHFTGEKNGRIMSAAPFYAFTQGERPIFPDPKNGIILY